MILYMTTEQALRAGFTHHGSYHGIPMWMGGIDGVPVVCAKWVVLENLVTIFHFLEKKVGMLTRKPPIFHFKVGREIEGKMT